MICAVPTVLFTDSEGSLYNPTRSYKVWRNSNLTKPQYSGTSYPIKTRTKTTISTVSFFYFTLVPNSLKTYLDLLFIP